MLVILTAQTVNCVTCTVHVHSCWVEKRVVLEKGGGPEACGTVNGQLIFTIGPEWSEVRIMQ
jgi:hypothetical protein